MENEYLYTIINTKWGKLGIIGSKKGVKEIILPGLSVKEILETIARKYKVIKRDDTFFHSLESMFQDYFSGKKVDLRCEIDTEGMTEFEKRVYEILLTVGYGEIKTYSWVAQKLKDKKLARAVGNALAKNPVPLVVPCHRIIPEKGGIGEYSGTGGSKMKKKLLELENADLKFVRGKAKPKSRVERKTSLSK